MVWSYTPLSTVVLMSNKDQVRFHIGDTDKKEPLLQNEEIEFAIDLKADGATVTAATITKAAIGCLKSLSAKFSRLGAVKIGNISGNGSTIAKAFATRAKELEESLSSGGFAMPVFGTPSAMSFDKSIPSAYVWHE